MPATITHAFFAEDVLDILPNNLKKNIDIKRMRMFGQSSDPFMFYNILNLKKGRPIREFQVISHTNKTQNYMLNLINYIKSTNKYNDIDVKTYLYGVICHYVLDSTVHPYVIYRTGLFNKNDKTTYKYNNLHAFMETFIDNDMVYRRKHINPYKFRLHDFCFNTYTFSKDLSTTLNYSFYKTYGMYNAALIYYNSLKQMYLFLKLFRYDRFGIKKFCYKFIDTFTSKKTFRFEALSYHYSLDDKHDFLNNEKVTWHNPANYRLTSNEAFIDLYIKSIKKAKELIILADKYINDDDNIELNKFFPDVSYLTGLECINSKEIKYFEF